MSFSLYIKDREELYVYPGGMMDPFSEEKKPGCMSSCDWIDYLQENNSEARRSYKEHIEDFLHTHNLSRWKQERFIALSELVYC